MKKSGTIHRAQERIVRWLLVGSVALLGLLITVESVGSAKASSGFNCRNDSYVSGGKCDVRRIAIATIIHYYDINKNRQDRGYGCNWYRVLRAFDRPGKWNYANHDSEVRGASNAPNMAVPPNDLVRHGCAVTAPMTTAEAQANRRNWSG